MRIRASIALFGIFLTALNFRVMAQGPAFEWAVRTGNAGTSSIGHSIDVDPAGNVYTAGRFTGTVDFDPGAGSADLISAGLEDAFITKMDPSGNLIWAKRVGGTQGDYIYANAIDGTGNVYLTGSFAGTVDFDPGPGVFNLTAPGGFVDDIFILKLDPDGNFLWAKRIGASGLDFGHSIAVGPSGVVTTGSFEGTVDFDPGAGTAFLAAPAGQDEIFILKLDANGDYVWAKRMGGSNGDFGRSITLDASESVYSTGFFSGTADFDPGTATFNLTDAGNSDIFVSKLDASGNFVWAKRMGGTGSEGGYGIKVDIAGNVYTTGDFHNTADFDPGPGISNLISAGFNDSFVSKLDASGNFIWAKRIGGDSDDAGTSLSLDGAGNVYSAGSFESSTIDLDPGPGTFNVTPVGSGDVFITKLDPSGDFVWAVAFGGPSFDLLNSMHVNVFGRIYTTGYFSNTVDFDPGAGASNLTAVGIRDIFVTKLSQAPVPPTIASFAPASGPIGTTVTINGTNFSSEPVYNIVYFGATRATVTAATITQLTVTVPMGATYEPITVTVAGLTAYSAKPFLVTFPDGGTIDACSFASPLGFGSDSGGSGVAMGDLDGDGKTDVVVTDNFANSIRVFRNTSTSGTINASSFAPSIALVVGTNPEGVSLSDIDGDGKLDIIATSFGSDFMSIFRNVSTPGTLTTSSFSPRVDFSTGDQPFKVSCHDFDGDGNTDIAVSNNNSGTISIWRNIGTPGTITTGSFAPRFNIPGSVPALAIADLDVDGKPDLIVGNFIGSSIGVLRNISTPGILTAASFAPVVNFTVGPWLDYVAVGDLDSDNRPDIVTSSWPGNTISILKNTSTPGTITAGSFASKLDIGGNGEPRGVWITDFDGDGLPDIGLSNQTSNVSIYKNANTPGTITAASFLPKVNYSGTGNARDLMSGDIDGDGKPDLVVATWGNPSLVVLRNTVSSLPPPTITGVSPTNGPVGTTVIITGTNFSGASILNNTVKFNGITATVLNVTPTTITAVVPAGATTGTISVTVGCNTTTGGGSFAVHPIITNFAPASGAIGTNVTISGTNFSTTISNNVVYFGATRATVIAAALTELTVIVPAGATYQPITVTVAGATGFSSSPFLVTFPDGGVIGACAFDAKVDFTTGVNPKSVAIGDVDGDGKADLVVANFNSNTISVFRNIGVAGSVTAGSLGTKVDFASGTQPIHVIMGDLDGDGKLDIAVTNFGGGTISVFRNTSVSGTINASSFATKVDFTTGAQPQSIAMADLDSDGKLDMINSNFSGSTFSAHRNISTPGLINVSSFEAQVTFSTGAGPTGNLLSDLDGDGKVDVATANQTGNTVSVFRNTSTVGSFSASTFATPVAFTTGASPISIAAGDLDGDSKAELVVANTGSNTVSVFRNTTTPGAITIGSFAAKVDFTTGSSPISVSIADIDGEGTADIALANSVSSNISVLRNEMTGPISTTSFAAKVDFVTGSTPWARIGDLDGDGKPDLAVASAGSGSVSILRNTVSSLPPPTISSFSPASGPAGTPITINGTNFSTSISENIVRFNGKIGIVTSATPTTLAVLVPGGATTGLIMVDVNCNGTGTSGSNFIVTPLIFNTCSTVTLNGAGDYITVNRNATVEPASLTIEALVNFSSAPSFNVIVAKSDGTVFGNSYALWYEGGLIRAGVRLGGSIGIPWTPTLGRWYHVALTYNSSTQAQTLYLDGAAVATGTSLPPFYSSDDLLIGADVNFGTHDGFFKGSIDEVRLWDVARTPQQILTHLTSNLVGNEPGLVLYHKINETGQGSGITVVNSATATGATNSGITVGASTTPVFQSSCNCVPIAERDALISLYNATDGTNWTDNTGWLSADVSTWLGVTVTGCNVTGLNLEGNNLNGTIPSQLVDLTMLESLHLGTNILSGTIPPEIGSLSNLQYLNLSFNSLSGTIPIELENLMELTDAYLNSNAFTGDAPNIGANSMNMSTLELQFNLLDYAPTTDLFYNIQNLDVSNNRLTFDDLEPSFSTPISSYSYSPQARVPPGGFISFLPGAALTIGFTSPGSDNRYQWFQDGVLIPGATSDMYTKFITTAADAGIYTVQITSPVLVPGLTLESLDYTVILDPCPPGPRTSGDLDLSFAPLIDIPSLFYGIGTQSDGKIIAASGVTSINSVPSSGVLRFNANGSIDNTFAVNGYGPFLIVQPDNKIIAASGADNLVRLLADGTDDPSFTSPNYYNATIHTVALQSDGKILISVTEDGTIYLDRRNTDGTDDPSFSAMVTEPCSSIRVQTDGKILVADQFGAVFRLDDTGAIDPSFNSPGVTGPLGFGNYVTDLAIQPDGKIIAVGLYGYFGDFPHGGIVRLHPDGSIDNSFTAFGISNPLALGEFFYRVTLQPDGKILLAGFFSTINGTDRKNIARLNADGTVDCSFNPLVSVDDGIYGMSLQTDGKILITGGFSSYEGMQRYGLARVNNPLSGSCLPASQRAALVALYNSTAGAGWTDNSNWLSADESTWFGVTITGCTVTAINLDNNNLTGPLPAGIDDLPNLINLTLSENHLSGTIPIDLGNLPSLRQLDLLSNQLTGAIPAELGDITTLEGLNLSNNLLSGSIPISLGDLPVLSFLEIYSNQLTGTIPPELANATSLAFLRLGSNQLSGSIPTSIGSLPDLFLLDLDQNQLTGPIPPELGNLLQLKYLNIYSNQLTGPIPTTFGNLTNLEILNIFTNQLSGTLPVELALCTQLKHLEVAENLFTGTLPIAYQSLVNLETFQINDNSFTGSVPIEYLAWTNIKDLYLANNQLDALPAFPPALITNLAVENNKLEFGDLESNIGTTGYVYSPQADLPGGVASVNVGSPLTIPFTTSGSGNQYQWFKNSVLIPGATSTTFSIASTTLADAGNYTVEITSTIVPGLTLKSLPFVVTIIPVINITLNTFDEIVCDGDIGTFVVAANGTTNITYQWQRGNDQAASLQGLRWSIPAISSAGADIDNVVDPPDVSTMMGGVLGTTYAVTLRFRGVAEAKTYVGGVTTGFWNVGGVPLAEGYNVYQLDISDPPATYYLNAGASGLTYTYLLDYVQTVNIKAGANVVLKAIAGDNFQVKNHDNMGTPIVVPGIPPSPFPFDGQFIQMDVVAINGGLFSDLSDGGGYSGTSTPTLSINTTGTFGAGRYQCRINGDFAAEVFSFDEGLFINLPPTAPGTSGNSGCASTSILLSATGASPTEYRWYTVATGGTAIAGAFNDTFATPVITTTTNYFVAINNGSCESTRTPVIATVIPLPTSPVVTPGSSCAPSATVLLNASGGVNGQYRWYTTSSGGTAIAGETNSTYITPLLSASITYFVSIDNGICESMRISVLAEIKSCTPAIVTTSLQTQVGGQTTPLDIAPLVATVNSPLDISSIKVVQQPISGALATVTSGVLAVDYTGVSFAGMDRLTIEACDMALHCAQSEITIEVVGDITVYNALSPNGDGKNEVFIIQYIDLLPDTKKNKVTIFNRWGDFVFNVDDYDNQSRVFRGLNNSGSELPTGTYFYKLEFPGGAATRTGFISLRR